VFTHRSAPLLRTVASIVRHQLAVKLPGSLIEFPVMPFRPARKRVGGHPRTGVRPGDKVSEYTRLTIRLPEDLRIQLEVAARALGRQQWRVIHDALQAYLGGGKPLSDEERRMVGTVARVRRKGGA
jgi:predicted transcriptional regulator